MALSWAKKSHYFLCMGETNVYPMTWLSLLIEFQGRSANFRMNHICKATWQIRRFCQLASFTKRHIFLRGIKAGTIFIVTVCCCTWRNGFIEIMRPREIIGDFILRFVPYARKWLLLWLWKNWRSDLTNVLWYIVCKSRKFSVKTSDEKKFSFSPEVYP